MRAVTRRDFTKPVRVAASAKPRAKSEVFGTIVQHVGIHRRDVAGVFHVMGSMIKADLSKSGSGVFKVYPGVVMPVDAYSVAQRARELCYQTSVLHDLVGELRATAEIVCQQAQVARHETRERRQVVKCHRYLRRSADRPAVVLPGWVASTPRYPPRSRS